MKSLRICLVLAAAGLSPAAGLGPRLAAKDLDAADLYDKLVKSCVYIVSPEKGGYSQGSGSLIDAEKKLVLTNYHVVSEHDQVFVQFPVYIDGQLLTDKEKYKKRISQGLAIKGKVLWRDKTRDLALVTLASIPPGTKAIRLARTSPRPNTPVWQIGNAGAVKQVFRISKGEVSAVGDVKADIGGGEETIKLNAKMVTATNPINPGDSGGPLFDARGHQVAVTESTLRGARLVSMFVDVTEVRTLLKERKITIKEADDDESDSEATTKAPKLVTPPKKDAVADTVPRKDNGATAPEPKKDDTPAASAEDEKAAAAMLGRAKLFADGGKEFEAEYKRQLSNIVKKYPGTRAGREAKKLLDGLK